MSRMSELVYPAAPGFKVAGPSKEAAEKVATTSTKRRAAVLEEFKRNPAGLTADEIATALNLSVLSVRPRVSELNRLGMIEQTGARRRNDSGMAATVWRIAPLPQFMHGK
jgi:predicted ArsR family transcriptional regulator